jgi:hypothetical protein
MNDRARIYATVLEELQRESRADWVLVDSLLPTDEIDADVKEKAIRELPVSRRSVDAFIEIQGSSVDRFQSIALPSGRWMTVSVQQLDSLRAAVRTAVAAGVTPRGIGNDAFWQRWQQRFPGTAGYVILSPASIDNDGLTALVHVRTTCGSICGETVLRRLRRDGGGAWRTTGRLRLSES